MSIHFSLRAWSVIPCLTGTIAWIVSLILLLDCRFLFLELIPTNLTQISHADILKFGLFAYQAFEVVPGNTSAATNKTVAGANMTYDIYSEPDECVGYPENFPIPRSFATSRACATVAVVLGGWMNFILWCIFCCRFFCLMCPDVLVIFNFLLTLPLMQGLAMTFSQEVCNFHFSQPPLSLLNGTLAELNGNFSCGISRQGLSYPFSIVLWIVTGLLFAFLRPRNKDDFTFFRQ